VLSSEKPIGQFLIILADMNTLEKVSASIHTWPSLPYATEKFSKGSHSNGCIRLKKEDMAYIFKNVELNTQVYIHR
jgi:hypothetical protein